MLLLPEQGSVDAERHCRTLDYVKLESVIGTCGGMLRRHDATASQKRNTSAGPPPHARLPSSAGCALQRPGTYCRRPSSHPIEGQIFTMSEIHRRARICRVERVMTSFRRGGPWTSEQARNILDPYA